MSNHGQRWPCANGDSYGDQTGTKMAGLFTDVALRALRPKAKLYKRTEPGARGDGRLMVRIHPDGSRNLFYRYRIDGTDHLIALGLYDSSGRVGITLAQARAAARKHTKTLHEHGDVRRHLAALERQREEQVRQGTFGDLCCAYAKHLADAGRISAHSTELALRRNIEKQPRFRKLWNKPASEVTADHIRDVLARLHTEGCDPDVKRTVTREVNKVRSYLHAAFTWGARADHDPRQAAAAGKRFGLTANPVSIVPRVAEWDRAKDRVLTDKELAAFWTETAFLPVVQRDFLRFLLALGGQRASQVLRATWSAYEFDARLLHLRDKKGKGMPRDHVVPLTDLALAQLVEPRKANRKAPGPFSSDGKRVLALETVSMAVRAISDKLRKRDKVPPFRFGDLRRTCETTLARLGVPREVRAWLLSHGRQSDVQSRHYDRHTYLPEKLEALRLWEAHLKAIQEPKQQRGAKSLRRRR